jgi:hypothetical protein
MSRLPHPPRPGGRTLGVVLCAALALAASVVGPAAGDTPLAHDPPSPRSEIGLPAPTRYAIIRQGPGGVQVLVASGDLRWSTHTEA